MPKSIPAKNLDHYTIDPTTCIKSRSERPGLGNVLLQHAPFLRMYADYVRNFDQAMELVRTWTERSSAFRNIIQDIQVWDSLRWLRVSILFLCTLKKKEVWAGSSILIVPNFRVRRFVAAWPCSTTCWNQCKGSHDMRCCSGIIWRKCQRITQIMSLLTVSMLYIRLTYSLHAFKACLPGREVCSMFSWARMLCSTLSIKCSNSSLKGHWCLLICKLKLSMSSCRVPGDNFPGSYSLKQRHTQSCTFPLHTKSFIIDLSKI